MTDNVSRMLLEATEMELFEDILRTIERHPALKRELLALYERHRKRIHRILAEIDR